MGNIVMRGEAHTIEFRNVGTRNLVYIIQTPEKTWVDRGLMAEIFLGYELCGAKYSGRHGKAFLRAAARAKNNLRAQVYYPRSIYLGKEGTIEANVSTPFPDITDELPVAA
jgi:hypothetical protein